MAATPSLVITMSFNRRGSAQLFSNRYHFSGGVPADDAAWEAFAQDVIIGVGSEPSLQSILLTNVEVVKAAGYHAGSDISVWSQDRSDAGGHGIGTSSEASSDSAMLLRWLTSARSSKGHPVYLMNYVHGVLTGATYDDLNAGQRSQAQDYAERWWNVGYTDGTNTYKRAGPNGATAVSSEVDPFVRHRDFPT